MTEEDKKLLNTFEGRLRQLLYLYEELEKENLSLKKKSAKETKNWPNWSIAGKNWKPSISI